MASKAPPERSAGARMERKAVVAYLRRKARQLTNAREAGNQLAPVALDVVHELLAWVLRRQQRYERRPGGLGRWKRDR